ncbi:MAG: cell division protein FtsK, partial [Pseudonocardia sp.]|nr:cell division protein FtsK [Pseudonocardia sp.]
MTTAVALPTTHPAITSAWLPHGPTRLSRIVTDAAPGPAGEHTDTWLGQVGKGDGSGAHPELWRIGTAQLPGHPHPTWPVAIPLLDDTHLQIDSTPATRSTAHHLVETLALRVLSTLRPGLVQVHVWDAHEVRGSLPGLYPLLPEGLLTPYDPTQLAELLDVLTDRIAAVRSRVLVHGHRSLRDQARADNDGVRTEPWTIVVLFGDGTNLKPNMHAALQRVGRAALTAGISLITVDVPVALPAPSEWVVLDGTHNCSSMTGQRARFTPDLPIAPRRLSTAAAAIATWYSEWRIREASFRDLLPAERGACSSIDGVAAPLGFSEAGAPVVAELADATPHALVGGPSGVGKTNLLLAWLMALAARYPPDELALYLLDFKQGVSFAPLAGGPSGEGWLPHARLVGVNIDEDREFGLAVLRFLSTEQKRRAAAAKKFGTTKLAQLRRADPDGHWPRIVVVLDEAQVMLEPRGDPVTEEAVDLLEDLARRGRSQGIHLVLASQNLAAVKALWSRGAIFEQFSLRIALPRARGVLADTNKAASDLPR